MGEPHEHHDKEPVRAAGGAGHCPRHQDGNHQRAVRRKDIGAREGFSQDYLEQILIRLREAKIVQALRGPGGGYRLARPLIDHGLGGHGRLRRPAGICPRLELNEPQCGRHTHCSARQVWQRLNRIVQAEMKAITIADILDGATDLDVTGLDDSQPE